MTNTTTSGMQPGASTLNLGAHMSVSGGLHLAFERARAAGCTAVQIFTKSERQWNSKPLTDDMIAQFRAAHAASGIEPVLVHDSYLINLASPKDELWDKSRAAFAHELERCEQLGIPYLVTHPGAHTGAGVQAGLQREADALNRLFADGVGGSTTVLLETTAGQGTTLGGRFEELAWLLDHVAYPDRLSICVDTCHIFAAGYDFRTPPGYADVFDRLIALVGVERIKAFHCNDSKGTLGGHLDRHAPIGEGEIGLNGFRSLVNDARFAGLPMVLETPKSDKNDDPTEDLRNLATLRSLHASAAGPAAAS